MRAFELVELERLDEVVVGAGVEPGDAVAARVARRQRRSPASRRGARASARSTSRPSAGPAPRGAARQAEIEQDEVEALARERAVGGGGVAHPVDGVALEAQASAAGSRRSCDRLRRAGVAWRQSIAAARAPPAGRSGTIAAMPRPAPRHLALLPRPGRDGAAVHPARRLPARHRLLAARPVAAAPGRARDRPGPGCLRRVRQALCRDPEGVRHRRCELRKTARRGREPARCCASPTSGVDIAFVQGGADDDRPPVTDDSDADADGLVSLGSLFYEPVWLFYRSDSAQRLLAGAELTSLAQLAGWRVNIGAPGSGVPNLMLTADRGEPDRPGQRSRCCASRRRRRWSACSKAEIDAIVFASAPESLMVQMLLQTPGIRLLRLRPGRGLRAALPLPEPGDAAARRRRPRAATCPPADVQPGRRRPRRWSRAKAPHPALVQLFVQAAQQVHGGAGWFRAKGDFPNASNTERPLAQEAAALLHAAARRCCSATCRSGSPTWSTACGRCW